MVTSKKLIVFSTLVLMLSGCYKVEHPDTEPIAFKQPEIQFQKSGTILLSRAMPQKVARASVPGTHRMMMPLIGYIPPSVGFLPADNETWLEIDSLSKKLTLFRGKKVLAVVQAEGMIGAEPGLYALQHKEKDPLWYAPDKYFSKRKLGVPTEDAQTRYLRGALLCRSLRSGLERGSWWTTSVPSRALEALLYAAAWLLNCN